MIADETELLTSSDDALVHRIRQGRKFLPINLAGYGLMALALNLDALCRSRSRKTLDRPRANFPISCEIGYGNSLEAHPKLAGLLEF